GLVVGWMAASALGYACARAAGRLERWPLVALTFAMWAAAVALSMPALRRAARPDVARVKEWAKGEAGLLVVLGTCALVFWPLFSSHMISEGPGGLYSGGSTWYDLGFHLALTNSFLYGENFPPASPSFPPALLHYPVLPDFLTAALVALGMSLRAALVSTGVALSLALAGLVYTFARRVNCFRREGRDGESSRGRLTRAAPALAVVLFLLNGGFGFLYLFADRRAGGQGLLELLWRPPANYANMWARGIHWTNVVADTLLPQRTSLFGLTAALVVFTLFAAAWERENEGDARGGRRSDARTLFAAGCLAGLLPLFHMHTYAAVGLVSGFLFCLRPRRAWLAFWTPAVVLALPSILNVLEHAAESGFVRLQPGWRGHAEGWRWPLYWLANVGPPALLALPAWAEAAPPWRKFYAAFVLLLVLTLVVVVSPNDYDNMKLMLYWHAATSVLAAGWLARVATAQRARPLGLVCATLLVILSTASGLLALRHEATNLSLFVTDEELAAAEFVRAETRPRSLFLTAADFRQPAWAFAGRTILRGEFLWHHGYPYWEREADARRVYAGSDDAVELLRHYRVDYVYLGPREREGLRARADFFDQNLPAVYRAGDIAIYDARGLRAQGQDGSRAPAGFAPREFASRVGRDPSQFFAEFERAGFAVYRYYLAARGAWPKYAEFSEDLKAAGRGVYAGAEGWERRLEENKLALSDAMLGRDEFAREFERMTDEEFVAALYANAGVRPPERERALHVRLLESKAETRASVFRRVAENGELRRREYDAAFLLMHYFGYLRRDPGSPPDRDLAGFQFWLAELRRTGDRRSLTRVFLESGEYKDQKSLTSDK
ncbi:MAG TPA: hypothetical protein VER32_10055, partial [Pyrinomonadaceae bacterium]|nr:hypothetical protein [Pyrinomonadaceae bacterium]